MESLQVLFLPRLVSNPAMVIPLLPYRQITILGLNVMNGMELLSIMTMIRKMNVLENIQIRRTLSETIQNFLRQGQDITLFLIWVQKIIQVGPRSEERRVGRECRSRW